MSLCTDPARSDHIPLMGGHVWCSIKKKYCRETHCLHGQNYKSSPKAMTPHIKLGTISLQRDHTGGKPLEETCAIKGWLWSSKGCWWGRGVQSHWAHTSRSCLGPITHSHNRALNGSLCWSWSGFSLAHHKSQKAPPATAHSCVHECAHPACWNEA